MGNSKTAHKPGSKPFDLDSIKDGEIRVYVRHLQDSVNKRNQELRLALLQNTILGSTFQNEELSSQIGQILEKMQFAGCSSIRCILMREAFGGNEETIKCGKGADNEAFAYLDEQVVHQTRSGRQLLIPDTTRIHSIKFLPDHQFPKAMAAYQFLSLPKCEAFLWMGFVAPKEFTGYELDLYSQICTALSKAIEQSWRLDELRQKNSLFKTCLDSIHSAVLLLNDRYEISYWNTRATEEIRALFLEKERIKTWVGGIETDVVTPLDIGDSHYLATVIVSFFSDSRKNWLIILDDDSQFNRQQSYLATASEVIGHDFGATIIKMQGFTKLLALIGELNPKQAEYQQAIQNGLDELKLILDDVLSINRITSGEGLTLSEGTSREIIGKAVELAQPQARQKRVEIEYQSADIQPKVWADRALLISAVYNLITDAVTNSRLGGLVTVADRFENGAWKIMVKDHGKGISQVDVEKIVRNRFLDEVSGSLGLVFKIARLHKGRLDMKSELGKGTELTLNLPNDPGKMG